MTIGPADALLLETFGPRSLAYLANADIDQVERRFGGGAALADASERALLALLPLAERLAAERLEHPHVPPFSLERLGSVQPGQDHSFGNLVRLAAGGAIQHPPNTVVNDDEVVAALCRMARDAYPQLLAGIETSSWHGPRLMLFQHPARESLQNAVMRDAHLAKMYPAEDPGLGTRGYVMTSLGRGGSVQSVMFGETLIGAAWERALMSSASPLLSELYESIGQSVSALRTALSGEQSHVPLLIAFTGFTSAGRAIATPWGLLRPMSDSERAAAPEMLEGAVGGTDAEGRSVTVSYSGEMVLATTAPFEAATERWDPDDHEALSRLIERFRGSDVIRRRSEAIQLAVLLGVDRPPGQWATARLAWHWTADPTCQARNMGWADTRSSPGFMPTELSASECEAVAEWCDRITSTGRSESTSPFAACCRQHRCELILQTGLSMP